MDTMKELNSVKTINAQLTADCVELKNSNSEMEDRSRRGNLRISGLHEDENENWRATEEKLKDLLKNTLKMANDVKFDRAHRVGWNDRNNPPPSTIVCKLSNY